MVYNEKLFIFDGICEVNESKAANWHGTLTAETAMDASRVAAPRRNAFKEFCDSDKQFRVSGHAQAIDGVKDDNMFKPHRMVMTEGEGWDMDGVKHRDSEHELLLERLHWQGSPDQRDSLVYSKGRDEYGPFISVGWMRPGNRITLARRHVSAADPRSNWSTKTVREEVLKQIYDEEEDEITMPPWQCAALNA